MSRGVGYERAKRREMERQADSDKALALHGRLSIRAARPASRKQLRELHRLAGILGVPVPAHLATAQAADLIRRWKRRVATQDEG